MSVLSERVRQKCIVWQQAAKALKAKCSSSAHTICFNFYHCCCHVQVLIKHNNNTGRWVMPFRPAWSPAGDAVCVGDLKRGVSVLNDSGAALGVLQAEALTAIPSRLAMHSCGLLAAATSSGRVHIFR